MSDLLPPPNTLGLPDKFTAWRKHQADAVMFSLDNEKRFTTLVAGTGSGKSVTYMAVALNREGRSCILTSTKGLQSQLMKDFSSIGLVDIRGRNSYLCRAETDGTRCDHGKCVVGFDCNYKDSGGCSYYDAYKRAKWSDLVVTNYSYWASINSVVDGDGLGDFTTLICDEAHDTPNVISSFMTVTLDTEDPIITSLLHRITPTGMTIEEWVEWADSKLSVIGGDMECIKEKGKEQGELSRRDRRLFSRLGAVQRSLTTLCGMDDNWVVDVGESRISFSPVWPTEYTEGILFRGVPNIHLTSATVCNKTLDLLGLKKEENALVEYPHPFPVKNRMLIHIPTIRLNYKTTPAEMDVWLRRIDQIIGPRQDRKGIVHSVSYSRRNLIMTKSKYKDKMVSHDSTNTEYQVNIFKNNKKPKVFVSPSITTGYDFPYDACRFQIIGKLAYPDTRDVITAARMERDPDYAAYSAAQQLVQCVGRAVRSEDDIAENFIIDDNVLWFISKYADFMPKWFIEAFTTCSTLPQPIKLKGDNRDEMPEV